MIIYQNTNIVFSLSEHRLEGSLYDRHNMTIGCHTYVSVRMRLGLASLTYADMALLSGYYTKVRLASLTYVDMGLVHGYQKLKHESHNRCDWHDRLPREVYRWTCDIRE